MQAHGNTCNELYHKHIHILSLGLQSMDICYPSLTFSPFAWPHSVFLLPHYILHSVSSLFPFSLVFSLLSPFSHLQVLLSTITITNPVQISLFSSVAFLNFPCFWLTAPHHLSFPPPHTHVLSSQYDSSQPVSRGIALSSLFFFAFLPGSLSLSLFLSCLFHPLLLLILYNPSLCIPL